MRHAHRCLCCGLRRRHRRRAPSLCVVVVGATTRMRVCQLSLAPRRLWPLRISLRVIIGEAESGEALRASRWRAEAWRRRRLMACVGRRGSGAAWPAASATAAAATAAAATAAAATAATAATAAVRTTRRRVSGRSLLLLLRRRRRVALGPAARRCQRGVRVLARLGAADAVSPTAVSRRRWARRRWLDRLWHNRSSWPLAAWRESAAAWRIRPTAVRPLDGARAHLRRLCPLGGGAAAPAVIVGAPFARGRCAWRAPGVASAGCEQQRRWRRCSAR